MSPSGSHSDIRKENATSDFLKAASEGNLAALEKAYAQGAAVNRSDKQDNTALIWGGTHGSVPMLDFLFARGAETCAVNAAGNNALMQALAQGHEQAAAFCLKKSFNMTAVNHEGQSAFAIAAKNNLVSLFDDIVAQGTPIQTEDAQGRTPLMIAAAAGHTAAVQKILSYPDTRLEDRDKEGHTALMLACLGGYRDCAVSLLKSGARVDVADARGRDMMFYARQWGLEDEVKQAFSRYDVKQITEGSKRDISVVKPLSIRRRGYQ